MKKAILISALTIMALTAAEPTCVLTVDNITTESGTISIGVYNTKESFPDQRKRMNGINVSIEDARKGVPLQLKPGTYAIGVYHDINNNQTLDKGAFGVPKEPYGFSNNVYRSMGRPDFPRSQFTVTADKTEQLTITLR